MEGTKRKMRPVLLVIAGPNGSGKTTITRRLQQDHWSEGVEYLNPDDIAQERFGGWNDGNAIKKAAEWTGQRREELLAKHKGIAFETVFSTPEKLDFLMRAKIEGYFVRVFFVSTESPTINAARVADRVMRGGHDVPISKIISRYTKSMDNILSAMQIADRVYLYDNSVDNQDALLSARTENGLLRKVYGPASGWVHGMIQDLEKHPDFEQVS